MAIGVMKYLNEHGKRVPEDVKLMGYDDVFMASVVEPSLSYDSCKKASCRNRSSENAV